MHYDLSCTLFAFCCMTLAAASFCQRVTEADPNWRREQANHVVTSFNGTSLLRLCKLTDDNRLSTHLSHLLVPRPIGSDNHRKVAQYIQDTLNRLGYYVEFDQFTEDTIVGRRSFRNIIGTLDPLAPRRLILACHYDSKDFRPRFEFVGATDSAVPCALMLDVAESLVGHITNRDASNVTLQLVFFDGEEAFRDWTSSDSLYGSRHLADLWYKRLYPPYNFYNTRELDRIDVLVLLDLLGTASGSVPNFNINDRQTYMSFMDSELRLRQLPGCVSTTGWSDTTIFNGYRALAQIDDDHMPFYRKGVKIMHAIAAPFPRVWHTVNDDKSALNDRTISNLAVIIRTFVARYLSVRI